MTKKQIVEELAAGFAMRGIDFEVSSEHDHLWHLNSPHCRLDVLFERFESDYCIEVSEPGGDRPMSLLLLRFLRRAFDSQLETQRETSTYYVSLFLRYFNDLLRGDFSIRPKYDAIHKEFFDMLFDAQSLPVNSVVNEKIAAFDLTWMDDMRFREC